MRSIIAITLAAALPLAAAAANPLKQAGVVAHHHERIETGVHMFVMLKKGTTELCELLNSRSREAVIVLVPENSNDSAKVPGCWISDGNQVQYVGTSKATGKLDLFFPVNLFRTTPDFTGWRQSPTTTR